MDLLSLSSVSLSTSPLTLRHHKPNSILTSSVKPTSSFYSLGFTTKASSSSFKTLEIEEKKLSIRLSSGQTPATAMRGAEADAMGMLLKERIVFLGNNIDDFVADAIISQLLLLDAQDPTKDIKLFVNSPGGSLRVFVRYCNGVPTTSFKTVNRYYIACLCTVASTREKR
ncbi:hypothetical protein ACFE04_023848 [Oxalis oulophora]